MKRIVSPVFGLALLLLFTQDSCSDNRVGPCVHIYEEPILHIEWVRNAQTGNYLRTVVLSGITIDSLRRDPFSLLTESRGVVAVDSTLVGNPPCAFGVQPGRYSFRVSADGYRDTVVVCFPAYSINKGGCPSSSNGGLRISITLQPI
jgi:hypothetical protein